MSDDNKLHAVGDQPENAEDPNVVKGREISERMVASVGRFFRWVIRVVFVGFPLALLCWWLASLVPLVPFLSDLGYWQWYGLIVWVRLAWGRDP